MIVYLCLFMWWLVGFLSAVFAITVEDDLYISDLLPVITASLLGPILAMVIIANHFSGNDAVILKKRK